MYEMTPKTIDSTPKVCSTTPKKPHLTILASAATMIVRNLILFSLSVGRACVSGWWPMSLINKVTDDEGKYVSRNRNPWFSLGYLLGVALVILVIILLVVLIVRLV